MQCRAPREIPQGRTPPRIWRFTAVRSFTLVDTTSLKFQSLKSQKTTRDIIRLIRVPRNALLSHIVQNKTTPLTAAEWGVRAARLPVQVFFENGVMQRVLLGVRSAQGIAAELAEYIEPS